MREDHQNWVKSKGDSFKHHSDPLLVPDVKFQNGSSLPDCFPGFRSFGCGVKVVS